MIINVNVAEAKAKLYELLDAVAAGDEVLIYQYGTPTARLVPIGPPALRRLGFFSVDVDDSIFEPLADDEMTHLE